MSLVRFRAKAHPQQTRGKGSKEDRRWTPRVLFDPLHSQYRFTVDAAADPDYSLLPRGWTTVEDGLSQSWRGERVWCNPPYSNIEPWVRKALEFEAALAVLLLPANRTEQRWWQELVEPFRDTSFRLTTRFLPGRINFHTPENPSGKWKSSAPFGCVLLVFQGRVDE